MGQKTGYNLHWHIFHCQLMQLPITCDTFTEKKSGVPLQLAQALRGSELHGGMLLFQKEALNLCR